jgi:hypothetical protein
MKKVLISVGLLSAQVSYSSHVFHSIEVPSYKGTAHQAFKVAESLLCICLKNCIPQDTLSVFLDAPFLNSFNIRHEHNPHPSAYALLCSDICADESWIDYDQNKRSQVRWIADRIVYLEYIGQDAKTMRTNHRELTKLRLHCEKLKKEQNHCFACVLPVALQSGQLSVVLVCKRNGILDIYVVGGYDKKPLNTFVAMAKEDSKLKQAIHSCLSQDYSSKFVNDYMACLTFDESKKLG